MSDLPIMLRVAGRRAVIVGGGSVALRRATALRAAGATVCVIAPQVGAAIEALGVAIERRAYRAGDCAGAWVVVIATDDAALNDAAAREAASCGALVNRADRPDEGDFIVPAHRAVGPITLAVSTDGISAKAAATIRDAMIESLDADWARLLAIVRPYRAAVQAATDDAAQRTEALHRLTDDEAMAVLKRGGETALRARCDGIVADVGATTPTSQTKAKP